MLQIENTVISFDVLEKYFVCDLDKCLGACCIEGDAGAPIEAEEKNILEELLPIVWDDLTPAAQEKIQEQGVSYIDEEGDLVTSIVNGKDCVFTCYDKGGMCQCAIEKAFRQGKTSFYKPISCHLYPIRIKQFGEYTAVNLHKWKICKTASVLGRKEGVKAYQFLKEPLIRKFGKAWYEQLEAAVKELPQLK